MPNTPEKKTGSLARNPSEEAGRAEAGEGRRRVLLGVTGGIAAYKAAEIVRLLVKEGCDVRVVMTRNATEFVGPLTFETLSGNPVWTEPFRLTPEHEVAHVALAAGSDLLLIAPATANILGKAASGIADDLLSTLICAASRIPIVFAPAMNVDMYRSPAVRENIRRLKRFGYDFIEPDEGELACGTSGPGRLAEPARIVEDVLFRLSPKDLAGERILVTAGPTEERIDPVRFLTNASSGKMGYAVARAAAQRGAEVTLVSGPSHCEVPLHVKAIRVRSAEEMRRAVMKAYAKCTCVVMAAAVSDFRPASPARRKVKKEGASLVLQLARTPDILQELGRKKGKRILIGFAAETDALVRNAREKLEKKNLDLIVANDVSGKRVGFQSDENQIKLIGRNGRIVESPVLPKRVLAHWVLDQIKVLREGGNP